MDNVVIYDSFVDIVLDHAGLVADPVRVMLLTSLYAPDPSHRMADVWGEVQGKGYTPGGKLLADKSVAGGIFRAADVRWSRATIKDAAHALLYREKDDQLVCCLTLDEPTSSRDGDFVLRWDEAGILDLRKALEFMEAE